MTKIGIYIYTITYSNQSNYITCFDRVIYNYGDYLVDKSYLWFTRFVLYHNLMKMLYCLIDYVLKQCRL